MKKYKYEALITVEASLVLPVFLFTIFFFLYFYEVLMVQDTIHHEATKECRTYSSFGSLDELVSKYVSKEDQLRKYYADGLIIEQMMKSSLDDNYLINQCIVGGADGISCVGSTFIDEEECVSIKVNYQIKFPFFRKVAKPISCIQQVKMRLFNGFAVASRFEQEEGEEEEKEDQETSYVYVTEHGRVYHTNQDCSYINISVQKVPYASVGQLRNKSGGKYYSCSQCCTTGKKVPKYVYITPYGTCYHVDPRCTKISRNVKKIPLSEAIETGLCECKRCKTKSKIGE